MRGRRILLILVTAVVVIGVGAWLWLRPRFETEFAPGYREATFMRLPLGVSSSQAEATLGKPLLVRSIESNETWLYCLRGETAVETSSGWLVASGEISSCPAVEFDQRGKVVDVTGFDDAQVKSIKAASSLGEIETLVGKPCVIRKAGTYIEWQYSRPKNSHVGYQLASLTFSDSGRLVDRQLLRLAD